MSGRSEAERAVSQRHVQRIIAASLHEAGHCQQLTHENCGAMRLARTIAAKLDNDGVAIVWKGLPR